jgi:hypothetical protein
MISIPIIYVLSPGIRNMQHASKNLDAQTYTMTTLGDLMSNYLILTASIVVETSIIISLLIIIPLIFVTTWSIKPFFVPTPLPYYTKAISVSFLNYIS